MFESTRGSAGAGKVREGMDVLDQNGEKIGKAGETMSGGRYFNVDAGFLGMKEYYVPFDAVAEVREDAVYLNTTKDRVDDMGWTDRPEEQETSELRSGERGAETARRVEGETLQLRQEELQARKERVETGGVTLGKEVVEQQRTMEVPVTREEVTIDRRPVDRRVADTPIESSESETIRVPVREERVDVEKTPVVYEEVGVGKREVTETQQVTDTVRREEARVDREGDVQLGGSDTARAADRERWEESESER